ncbi:MAG: FtsX-like permease family protein, partial [Actinomycetota bacterium]
AAGDANYGVTVNRVKVLEGRMPRPESLDEAAVAFTAAKSRHLHLGSTLTVTLPPPDPSAQPLDVTLHVVGIVAVPGEFPPQLSSFGISTQSNAIHVSDGFFRLVKDRYFYLDFLLLRFKHGSADVQAVNDALNGMAGDKAQLNANLNDQAANVQRSIHLQAVALWIVGALVALIGLMVLSQLLSRQAVLDATENPTLLALGMTRTQVWLTGMGRAAAIGVAGAGSGVVLAVALSPLMPIGTARVAEPHPGLSIDPMVLGLGVVATLLGVLLLAAWPVWKSARVMRPEAATADGSTKPSLVARTAASPIFSPPVATGMRLALEPGRGRTEVPVRSSLLSVILAIAALVSALTFAACLDHLLATPRLYGWNWDAYLSNESDNPAPTAAVALKQVEADTQVEDAALIDTPPIALGEPVRARMNGLGLRQVKGLIAPVVLDGRTPTGAYEVALGAKTLRDLHAHIGSTVTVGIDAIQGAVKVPLRVVGSVVLPPSSDSARLGVGAVFPIDAEKTMIPASVNPPPITDFLIRFAPGVDKKRALAQLLREVGSDYSAIPQTRPSDLVNFGQVQNLPLLLAGLVALLAAATLAHTLVTSVRRRRRDLAILKMLGFVPGQVRWAVAWQATTFIAVALLIGLPLGIAVGRTIWTVFAGQVGVQAEPVTPAIALLLTIPGGILLANLIAAVPAVIAGRMRPAVVLRAE